MKKVLSSILVILMVITLNYSSRNNLLLVSSKITSPDGSHLTSGNISANEANKLLAEGNKRFVEGNLSKKDLSFAMRKKLNREGQTPFATIISCSDSRVPPEIVFDQALGDLFVIRNAGNLADPIVLGSVEYGAEHLNIPLIVVLGHENCGAVKAVVDGAKSEGSLNAILEKIKPICQKLTPENNNKNVLLDKCIDANIQNTMEEIRKDPLINKLEKENKLKVIGAKYHMESGKVIFQ